MKKEEVNVRENLIMNNTELDENGTRFKKYLFQKLSDSTFKNVPSLSVEEEEMLLEDIDQEFIDEDTKTVLFLSIANDLVYDAKTYMAPREALQQMHSVMKDSTSNSVEEILDAAKRDADAFSESIDDSELHVIQGKENLVQLAQKSYQTAIESATIPIELLRCANGIAEDLGDQEWASPLFYEAVKEMDNQNLFGDHGMALVISSLRQKEMEFSQEQIKEIFEIILENANDPVIPDLCESIMELYIDDSDWIDQTLKRTESVV